MIYIFSYQYSKYLYRVIYRRRQVVKRPLYDSMYGRYDDDRHHHHHDHRYRRHCCRHRRFNIIVIIIIVIIIIITNLIIIIIVIVSITPSFVIVAVIFVIIKVIIVLDHILCLIVHAFMEILFFSFFHTTLYDGMKTNINEEEFYFHNGCHQRRNYDDIRVYDIKLFTKT